MAKLGRWFTATGFAIALGLPMTMGCQTSINGMTLPSGYYLKDSPDYIPKTPEFPLINELNNQQKSYNDVFGGAGNVGPGGAP